MVEGSKWIDNLGIRQPPLLYAKVTSNSSNGGKGRG